MKDKLALIQLKWSTSHAIRLNNFKGIGCEWTNDTAECMATEQNVLAALLAALHMAIQKNSVLVSTLEK